jgi:hypothetical protein
MIPPFLRGVPYTSFASACCSIFKSMLKSAEFVRGLEEWDFGRVPRSLDVTELEVTMMSDDNLGRIA